MIETNPIDPEGFPVACPHCQRLLYLAHPTEVVYEAAGYLSDGDTIPIHDDLAPEQRDGFGWYATLDAGTCDACRKPLFEIAASFMDVEPDEEVENRFFHRNADMGDEHHFIGRRGAERWLVTRFDTPQGPMLEHAFGPFADNYGNWIGTAGVASCRNGGPWEFAREFLLERWAELRSLPKAIGLDPNDPRAVSRAAPVSARAAREEMEPTRPEMTTPIYLWPGDLDDDEVPF